LFANFSNVWAQYRIDQVMMTLEPVASGANVSVVPVINCLDEDNVLGVRGQSYGNLLPLLGYMRTGGLSSP